MENYPRAYVEYLVHFHATRDYFECHEIMEEFWLEANKESKYLALIQLAVAVYHERQGNINGSLRLYRKVLSHMRTNRNLLEELGLNEDELEHDIKTRMKSVMYESPYEPMDLPLDEELELYCQRIAKQQGLIWKMDDRKATDELIYKHRLRNRDDVIEARQMSLIQKQKQREQQTT
ncbi:DUF309 domain-containing protein [Paenalkalicoccus suaedae]|uniref:DUF309 domain-containing protein n=1 Tax=Paenalkalicoccus suaedae TaxID=2592382 RepID=A0A859FD89_9BACI|nr:DUF309 domain-containing protein [Paenalkalicoccus suaedae]QKS71037.1 DUF309 domain-containing protein [Paenalkalicoccus suaedae]